MGNGIAAFLNYLTDCVLQIIYSGDGNCIHCGEFADEDEFLCPNCISEIKFCDEEFILKNKYSYYSVAYYSRTIMELILKLKYKSDFRCGEAIAKLMLQVIEKKGIQFDVITFIPSSRSVQKKRGYNQSEYLAKLIGKYTKKPVKNCLSKVVDTKDQIGLDKTARWDNLLNSFKAINTDKFINMNILLVDDVITTGATAFYCAEELKVNGAEEVTILTAAKSKL